MYSSIALKFGYAESSVAAWLVLSIPCKFKTKREALEHLANTLYTKYNDVLQLECSFVNDYKKHMAQCCQTAWSKRKAPLARCPVCDARYDIEQKPQFDIDKWENYLYNLLGADADSWGEEYDWDPWSFDFKTLPIIVNCWAENILTIALLSSNKEVDSKGYAIKEWHKDMYEKLCKEE